MVLSERGGFDLAQQLRSQGAPLGDLFRFVSGLYFRGKLAYSERFASAPPGLQAASYVIAPGRGLLPPHTIVTLSDFQAMAAVPVDGDNPGYREPLARSAAQLAAAAPECEIVLLGSVATPKYIDPLLEVFGERLTFPIEFVGRGDMSRGGLMLRCVREGRELSYIPALGAIRRGSRAPKLPPSRFRASSAPSD